MKVKVGDKIYDSKIEPVMVILSEGEKEQISNMEQKATKYCVYPSTAKWIDNNFEGIKNWMKT